MWQSMIETAKSNPFGNPFRVAHCESSDRDLVPGRTISAAATATGVTFETGDSCEFGSTKYFALCGLGGILSCGITHTAIVPLDLVKCRIQVNPAKYRSIVTGFQVTIREDGTRGLAKGWAPTFYGYSMQELADSVLRVIFEQVDYREDGAALKLRLPHTNLRVLSPSTTIFLGTTGLFKFGLYEVFKVLYSDLLGEENTYIWRTSLYLAASASAEFFADIALSPMEAAKVRIQTQPGFASTLRAAMPIIYKDEGLNGFYKGLVPLWMRQIPYTMMKFACFEKTIELLYRYVVPKPRSQCSKAEQLMVTFAAGYIAGVFCAIVSHPADTVVSKLNQEKGSTALEAAKKLGFAGLWKGLAPRIIMIGTLTAAQWFIYDAVKVYLRLPRPPPPEMPESLKRKLAAKEQ